jgi:predicted enzyme related to lactoylglutathione lyase
MAATFRHFAINADDVPRAKAFYEQAFGWTYTPWGPPGFYQTRSSGIGHVGALQGRRSLAGQVMPDVELSFGVDDIAATSAAITAHGGQLLMPPFHIEGVGHLIFFADTEGNIAGAMQYEAVQWPEAGEAVDPKAGHLSHFSVNADDVDRARAFYEAVFGWTFTPWGPPGFLQLGGAGVGAALQGRHDVDGRALPGLAVTIGVEEIGAAAAAIAAAGGTVLSQPFHIGGVGHHIFFQDTEGAIFAAMQYEARP